MKREEVNKHEEVEVHGKGSDCPNKYILWKKMKRVGEAGEGEE